MITLPSRRLSASITSPRNGARHNGTPDSGTLLTAFNRHLPRHLLYVKVELGRPRQCIRTQNRGVERIGSMVKRTELRIITGCWRSLRPVVAEPVKVTAS